VIGLGKYATAPMSKRDIILLANAYRKRAGYSNESPIDICKFLENELPSQCPWVNYEYDDGTLLNREIYAQTDIVTGTIRIKNDVYIRAVNGIPRDRFTIAHEAAHSILHTGQNPLFKEYGSVRPFEDPEWQANVFAAELLAPCKICKDLSIPEIVTRYNVSATVARIQKENGEKFYGDQSEFQG